VSTDGKKNDYIAAKQTAKSRQDIVGLNCVKDPDGKTEIESNDIKEVRRKSWRNC